MFPNDATPRAIRDAVDLGANVINLSLGTTNNSQALRSAVEFALASNVVVAAAAGNDSCGGAGPFYPAAYPGVLSVGAVGPDGSLASFSDRRTPVSVTAPGINVTGAYPGDFPDAYNPRDRGTSFATPFVSGVAALVRAYHPDLNEAQVVARIKATADGAAGPGTGNGMVNPVQAVTAVLPAAGLAAAPGAAARPGRVSIIRATPPGRFTRTLAMSVTAAAFGLAVVVAGAAVVLPAGVGAAGGREGQDDHDGTRGRGPLRAGRAASCRGDARRQGADRRPGGQGGDLEWLDKGCLGRGNGTR